MDIHGMSFMHIHGIYLVYRGISMDIPSFLKPDFAAGPCCWSHSMRTRVWVIKSILFHAPPWQLCQGPREEATNKRLNPAAANLRIPSPSVACGGGDGGGGGSGAACVFPFLAAGNDLNLGERWGQGSLQGR